MAYMDRITLRICSLRSRSNVLTMASSQLHYLRLFYFNNFTHLHRMSGGEFLSFVLSSAVRTDDNQNAAMLLCLPLTGSIEDESTAAANPKAIVFNVGGR